MSDRSWDPPVIDGDGVVVPASVMFCSDCGRGALDGHADGCPALSKPVHVDTFLPEELGVRFARNWTLGQRPIVVHRGVDLEGHVLSADLEEARRCPCRPTVHES